MSEPRWNDADAREQPRRPARPTAGDGPGPPGRRSGPGSDSPKPRPAGPDTSPRWGELPLRRGIVLVAAASGFGALLTVVTRSDPGFLLGLLVVAGTVAACLAVNPRRAYLIIPAPALAYLAAAAVAGLITDRAADGSNTLLAINAARWLGSGFIAMTAATLLAAVITGVRWLRTSRELGSPEPAARRSQSAAPASRPQPERDPGGPAGRRLSR